MSSKHGDRYVLWRLTVLALVLGNALGLAAVRRAQVGVQERVAALEQRIDVVQGIPRPVPNAVDTTTQVYGFVSVASVGTTACADPLAAPDGTPWCCCYREPGGRCQSARNLAFGGCP